MPLSPYSSEAEVQSVTIPIPPTANHIWKVVSNRIIKGAHYRQWLQHCSELMSEHMKPVAGPVEVTITIRLGKGFSRDRDLDNCIKPVLDALKPPHWSRPKEGEVRKITSHGASTLEDDNHLIVQRVVADTLPPYDKKSDAECIVTVRKLEAVK